MTSLKKPSPLDFKTQYGLALDDTDDAIIVDLFAGGGGASTGLEMGLGRKVDLAINHNPAAISMHEANHPHAEHLPTDVWGIDPIASTKGKTVGWLHASPDCRHHSQAAGGQPRKKEIRDLSWVVVKWAGKLQKLGRGPWVISLENVKQILQWGPLIAKRDKATGRVVRLDGTVAQPGERVPRHEQFLVPDPKRKGRTWRQFLRALEGFGYHVDYWVERNCDYGDPTTRQRLYLVATDGGFEPVAAEKTHAAKPSKGLKPYRTAAECIDWSDLGQSIRNRKKPLAEATMRRIAKGIEKEVLQRAADEPLHTVSAGGTHHGLVTAEMVASSLTPEQLDGAVWVAAFLMKYHGMGENIRPMDEPVSTVTTKDRLALVTVWISGSPYVIVDIRLRMLKPRELYRAQGFPDSYIIERGHNGQRFTLSQQVHMCGNSVSPNTMAAYARANDPWKRRLRPRPQQVAA
ncbi:DNA cytosine methyltransferase [Pseudomonas aeruginosa]|uniref:DNA cytosine methyltransferase n=1 Tax=Pseudomonas aeruginosa TaxID=287 RepID=UPI0038873749